MLACMTSASINRSRQLLVSHVGIDADDAHQRTGYFAALNRVQKHRFPFDPASGGYLLVFAAPDADTEATMRHFLDVDGLTEDHLYVAAERERIAAGMLEGSRILRQLAAPYAQVVSELTGAFVFARMRGAGGGSQGDVLGAIWLSPPTAWDGVDFAEAILHETVHQALFLDQLVEPTYTATFAAMRAEGALVTSAIRKTARPYDLAFHAAGVAATLAEFYASSGLPRAPEKVRSLLDGLGLTLPGLRRRSDLLTDRGRVLLDDMAALAQDAERAVLTA